MKKGFTLIELLFTMAIIAIIAGIGITQMSGSTDTAEDVSAKAELRNAITDAQLFYANNLDYDGYIPPAKIGGFPYSDGSGFCFDIEGKTKTYKYDSKNDSGIVEGALCGSESGGTGGTTGGSEGTPIVMG